MKHIILLGGFYDFKNGFDTAQEALDWCKNQNPNSFKSGYYHMIDIAEEKPEPIEINVSKD